ncbi:MAG TPA: hypothetical protein VGL35_14050 [Rhizomicrobium sp.]|jgi:hypothetical protein
MTFSLRVSVAAAAAALLSAAVAPGVAQAQPAGHGGAYHIFATPSYEAQIGRHPDLGTTGEMEYFGGTVFSKVEVVSVMWGSNVNSTTVAEAPDFSAALVNSTFLQQLKEYKTKGVQSVNGHKGSRQTIKLGSYFGQVQITPKNQSLNISDKQIQKELAYQIGIGALPPQGPNILYMIYFPSDITITLDGLTSCVQFGAYHFASYGKRENPENIFYAVEPDCGGGINNITYAASHEFAEATTDNIPTPGSSPAFPQAWNTSDGYEIGDVCEGYSGELTDKTRSYEVTQVYLNSKAGCSTGNYQSPP